MSSAAKPRLFVSRPLPLSDLHVVVGPAIDIAVFSEDRPPKRHELLRGAANANGIVTLLSDRIDAAFLDACPALEVVANCAVGIDNIDLTACAERGVIVTNTPDVLTDATADLAFTLLLALARRVREGEALLRSGRYQHWSPSLLLGLELSGRTLGIFGMGRIGKAMARRAEGFGMKLLHTSRRSGVPLSELLTKSDVISIHAPLAPETHHAFNAHALRAMKPSALLINTARGPLVDEAALVHALENREIAGAGLDVYEDEPAVHPGLIDRNDVVLLPHLGSATRRTRARMATLALQNAATVLQGDPPLTPVTPSRG